jgi:uncharacterized membrane protein YdjX (TVP38/TMEM64 family)
MELIYFILYAIYWIAGITIAYLIVRFLFRTISKPFKKDSYETIQVKAHESKPPAWMKE